MPPQPTSKRKYDSSKRQARAAASQAKVIATARELFVARGYSGVTIEEIAQEADVSAESIYSVFRNKRTLLSRTMEMAAGTDGDPVPVLLRSYIQQITSERDQQRQIRMFASRMQLLFSHMAPLVQVMRAAAETEPEIDALLTKYLEERLQGMGFFVDCLLANGPLRHGLDRALAAETIWAVASADVYNLLVRDRNWSGEEYEAWLSATLNRVLLP